MPVEQVRIEGLTELRVKMRALDKAARKELNVIAKAAAVPVATEAARRVPKLTGRLAASIRAAGTQKGAKVRAGRSAVPYAGPIHFGWPARNIRPQPFLYDALDDRRNEVLEAYERGMTAIIARHGL